MTVYSEKPAASRGERLTSFDIADFPIPTGREEEWRFTPIDKLAPLFQPIHDSEGVAMDVSLAPEVHGEVVPASDPCLGLSSKPADRTAATAWHAAGQAVVITIPRDTTASEPTTLLLRAPAVSADQIRPAAVKILLRAEPGSKGVVVIDHVGLALVNETIELRVDEGAELTVVALQDWADGTIHASSHRATIAGGGKLKHIVATFGGDVVRLTPDAVFTGPGAEVELSGLYFTDAGQHHENRLFVDHAVPDCKSRVTYKGALQGRGAHAVWVGDVLIQAAASGTDTYELNRNLLLTEGARADSVPNLEIETGEIAGAGHASATGRFDDEQLFYLMSRGIPQAEALRLVVRGFFAELIQTIGVAEVEERLLTLIESELEKSMGALQTEMIDREGAR